MASDGVQYTPGSGTTVAGDQINAQIYQVIKVAVGASGTDLGYVGPTNPLPVAITSLVVVTTQASVSVSGMPVWMNPTQGVTILGTQVVSQTTVVSGLVSVTGVSVGVVVSGVVSISVMPAISGAVSISAIAASQTIGTIVTVLGAVVSISQIAASMTIGTVVTVLGAVLVSVSALPLATMTTVATPGAAATGLIVWNAGLLQTAGAPIQASTGQIVTPKYVPGIPFVLQVQSTVIAISYTTYAFTVWVGTSAPVAGTGQYPVPAGTVLRLLAMNAYITNPAVAGGSVLFMAVAASTTTSLLSAAVATQPHLMILPIPASSGIQGSICGGQADVAGTSTLAIGIQASTSCSIGYMILQGYLF